MLGKLGIEQRLRHLPSLRGPLDPFVFKPKDGCESDPRASRVLSSNVNEVLLLETTLYLSGTSMRKFLHSSVTHFYQQTGIWWLLLSAQ